MQREQRRLAAVLAADMVGYSRLMGRDEAGTLARLKEHRAQRLEPALARNGGRLVKLTGDGALAEFPSAVDALRAAMEFQQAIDQANATLLDEQRIVFRLGLHVGDLIVDGDDLYGDGVNVAARLEAEAPPGGIVVSGALHEAAAGKLQADFVDLGRLSLKNIDRRVQAYRVEWGRKQQAAPATASAPLALPDKPSIAVLPFQNMSGDPEQEYFADGVVEDIITALSRFKSLFVIARNSSFTYKGKAVDIKQVGRELGVRYVLEGSVRRTSDRLRITGQLIEAQSGSHLWADRFDGTLEDVFDLQDRVTERVVGSITPHITRAEIERGRRKSVISLDAYDCYLRGSAILNERSSDAGERALVLFQRAIELDPTYAAAYAGAAHCYQWHMVTGHFASRAEDQAEVRRLAARLSAVGCDDADALAWVGAALLYVCRDYDTGIALIDQAIELNPNSARAWANRGWACVFTGRHDAACEAIDRTMRLSPVSLTNEQVERCKAFALTFLSRHAEAVDLAERVLARQPNVMATLRVAAFAHGLAGNTKRAAEIGTRLREIDPALRLSILHEYSPLQRPEDIALFAEGLRRAGIPE